MDKRALGAAADGPRDVRNRGSVGPAREDEFLERREFRIERLDGGFESLDVNIRNCPVPRNGQFAPKVEEIVLDRRQQFPNRGRDFQGEQEAERRVELVDVAYRSDSCSVLAHARSVAEAGGAGISRLGDDA